MKAKNEIIEDILDNEKDIFEKIKIESISVYLFLKKEYKKGKIKENTLFQFVFKSFYALDGAGLSDQLKTRYFELMAKGENDLNNILVELYELKNRRDQKTIQFSFATKLLHTIDESRPIFDSEVAAVIHCEVKGKTPEERIESCINIYTEMCTLYGEVLENESIKKIILKFRNWFNLNEKEISDVKVLDFIIWSLGKIIKGK